MSKSVVIGFLICLVGYFITSKLFGNNAGIIIGITSGFIAWLYLGGTVYMQYIILHKIFIFFKFIPPDYSEFLKFVTECKIMEEIENLYIFRHNIFQKYFQEYHRESGLKKF